MLTVVGLLDIVCVAAFAGACVGAGRGVQAGCNVESFDDVLGELRIRFAASVPTEVVAWRPVIARLHDSSTSAAACLRLRREIHRIAGTAGTLGFQEAGRLSAAMELVMETWPASDFPEPSRRVRILDHFVPLLSSALQSFGAPWKGTGAPRLILVELDDSLARPLIEEALNRGWFVERLMSQAAQALLDTVKPPAVASWGALSLTLPRETSFIRLSATTPAAPLPRFTLVVVERAPVLARFFDAIGDSPSE